MTIRERVEEQEVRLLAPYAAHAKDSLGRDVPEEPCVVRTCFQRDTDRIIHSKAFRRLKHKTQVFISPEGDHFRTRLTHTLEVSQIARTMVRALRLNEDLTEAICMGHDLGHTPFGHSGERELMALTDGRFSHNRQSVRVVEKIEKDGNGLNLTKEVRDGILHHSGEIPAQTLEGKIVHLADRIAYINHDIDDALRAGLLREDEIPKTLGTCHSERINTLVMDIIHASDGKPEIHMSEEVRDAMLDLRGFMFRHVYRIPVALREEEKVRRMVRQLFEYYSENPDEMPNEFRITAYSEGIETAVCDYIAGMTDRYAIAVHSELFIPKAWDHSI
ncbi:MAG: deoxyguanosinetriphosphate triphosphohydrolase [Ruminococcaceae bacterium]|nr:deoxyguanosinetriphosphate triphosphohydrolase [Oscillospiraceae bacterium]